jgi:hypothetical protein
VQLSKNVRLTSLVGSADQGRKFRQTLANDVTLVLTTTFHFPPIAYLVCPGSAGVVVSGSNVIIDRISVTMATSTGIVVSG